MTEQNVSYKINKIGSFYDLWMKEQLQNFFKFIYFKMYYKCTMNEKQRVLINYKRK